MDIKQVKCSCEKCICIVDIASAIKDDNSKLYCSAACATGHPDGKGCGCNTGCDCG